MTDVSPSSSNAPPYSDAPPPRRRFFYRFCTALLGFLLGLVPLALGTLFFLDPLLRRRKESGSSAGSGVDAEGFIKLEVGVASLPEDGTPLSVRVVADKVDAWNRFKDVEIGTVWLRKKPDGEVLAFNSICPHLGCAVDYRSANGDFFCPCHTSAFDLDGQKTNEIPPRPMDRLDAKIKAETGDAIWVKYQNFRAATEHKIPIS